MRNIKAASSFCQPVTCCTPFPHSGLRWRSCSDVTNASGVDETIRGEVTSVN